MDACNECALHSMRDSPLDTRFTEINQSEDTQVVVNTHLSPQLAFADIDSQVTISGEIPLSPPSTAITTTPFDRINCAPTDIDVETKTDDIFLPREDKGNDDLDNSIYELHSPPNQGLYSQSNAEKSEVEEAPTGHIDVITKDVVNTETSPCTEADAQSVLTKMPQCDSGGIDELVIKRDGPMVDLASPKFLPRSWPADARSRSLVYKLPDMLSAYLGGNAVNSSNCVKSSLTGAVGLNGASHTRNHVVPQRRCRVVYIPLTCLRVEGNVSLAMAAWISTALDIPLDVVVS